VLEEMRRVRRYFAWRSNWWCERANMGRPEVRRLVKSGRAAYAYKQANIIEALSQKFISIWQLELQTLNLEISLIDDQ
jgi:hypothetical protein